MRCIVPISANNVLTDQDRAVLRKLYLHPEYPFDYAVRYFYILHEEPLDSVNVFDYIYNDLESVLQGLSKEHEAKRTAIDRGVFEQFAGDKTAIMGRVGTQGVAFAHTSHMTISRGVGELIGPPAPDVDSDFGEMVIQGLLEENVHEVYEMTVRCVEALKPFLKFLPTIPDDRRIEYMDSIPLNENDSVLEIELT